VQRGDAGSHVGSVWRKDHRHHQGLIDFGNRAREDFVRVLQVHETPCPGVEDAGIA
jgi:hypothetical protein